MDLLDLHVLGRGRCRGFLGGSAPKVDEIRFHTGHPPMAAGPNGNAPPRVAGPTLIHISPNRTGTDSLV